MSHLEYTFAARCVKGRIRECNQDNFYLDGVIVPHELMNTNSAVSGGPAGAGALAVFDGMGGEAMGDYAAFTAASRFLQRRTGLSSCPDSRSIGMFIDDIADEINRDIREASLAEGRRIGTTIAALVFRENAAHAANIGDSSVFLMRRTELRKLTQDDTLAAWLITRGILGPNEARTDPRRSMLTQNLGMTDADIRPKAHFFPDIQVHHGDRFLLCSDGLTDMLDDKSITRILGAAASPDEAAGALTDAAVKAGGRDNITALTLFARRKRSKA